MRIDEIDENHLTLNKYNKYTTKMSSGNGSISRLNETREKRSLFRNFFFPMFISMLVSLFVYVMSSNHPNEFDKLFSSCSCIYYKRFANLMENSPAFTDNSIGIAKVLRDFCVKISDSNKYFEKIYNYEESLILHLEYQIEEIGNTKTTLDYYSINFYFHEKIRNLKETVEETKNVIVSIENLRDSVENSVMAEIKKIEEYIDDDKSNHREKGKKYLRKANEIERSLHKSAEFLMQINNMLIEYRGRLFSLNIQVPHERSRTVQHMKKILNTAKLFQKNLKRKYQELPLSVFYK
ncbi:9382_t:CDS:2 [Diversispora eburnea]|uniref:9382_t:CDS:1 n=1 Tax=Diversispora eburnea TaxID=1213867 RepID=A0A9N9B1H8_9GLOM|nr:9382_t:CDS:2 [Diversispora eburnea]